MIISAHGWGIKKYQLPIIRSKQGQKSCKAHFVCIDQLTPRNIMSKLECPATVKLGVEIEIKTKQAFSTNCLLSCAAGITDQHASQKTQPKTTTEITNIPETHTATRKDGTCRKARACRRISTQNVPNVWWVLVGKIVSALVQTPSLRGSQICSAAETRGSIHGHVHSVRASHLTSSPPS